MNNIDMLAVEKMGFSFFAGFAIGYAAKFVSKIVMFFAGTFILGLFILQYNNILVIDWASMNSQFSVFAHSFSLEGQTLITYMQGNFQNGAAFIGGLILGWRKV